jgi:hypothetical protein
MAAAVREWLPRRSAFGTAVYTNGLIMGEIIPVATMLSLVLPYFAGNWRMALPLVAAAVALTDQPRVSLSSRRARDIFRIARVQAEASGSKMRDLQQPADDHDVLEKMNHLILIGEVSVKKHRRCQNKRRQT